MREPRASVRAAAAGQARVLNEYKMGRSVDVGERILEAIHSDDEATVRALVQEAKRDGLKRVHGTRAVAYLNSDTVLRRADAHRVQENAQILQENTETLVGHIGHHLRGFCNRWRTRKIKREMEVLNARLAKAGAQMGILTVSLVWHSKLDLDLAVIPPSGNEINYRNKSHSGGCLDVDMNASEPKTDEPVENVYFEAPELGAYRVRVTTASDTFQVVIKVKGVPIKHVFESKGQLDVCTFQFAGEGKQLEEVQTASDAVKQRVLHPLNT